MVSQGEPAPLREPKPSADTGVGNGSAATMALPRLAAHKAFLLLTSFSPPVKRGVKHVRCLEEWDGCII